MNPIVADDPEMDALFRGVAEHMQRHMGYSASDASRLSSLYYDKFTNIEYCRSLGINPHNKELFEHEHVDWMAPAVHYYVGINGDPRACW